MRSLREIAEEYVDRFADRVKTEWMHCDIAVDFAVEVAEAVLAERAKDQAFQYLGGTKFDDSQAGSGDVTPAAGASVLSVILPSGVTPRLSALEAIACAKQLRGDQGREALLQYLGAAK